MTDKRKKSSSGSDKAVSLILIVMGVLLILLGIRLHTDMVRLKKACTETSTAIVVKTEEKSGKHKKFRAKLFYVTRKAEAVNAYTKWSGQRYKVNETVDIRYDPNDTKSIYIDGRAPYNNSGMVLCTLAGGSLFVPGALILLQLCKKSKNCKRQTAAKRKNKK